MGRLSREEGGNREGIIYISKIMCGAEKVDKQIYFVLVFSHKTKNLGSVSEIIWQGMWDAERQSSFFHTTHR